MTKASQYSVRADCYPAGRKFSSPTGVSIIAWSPVLLAQGSSPQNLRSYHGIMTMPAAWNATTFCGLPGA